MTAKGSYEVATLERLALLAWDIILSGDGYAFSQARRSPGRRAGAAHADPHKT